jgi:hypothetical protein
MAIPRGWHYIPGTGRRRVMSSDGTIHSRQEAENTFARAFGFESEYARKRAAASSGYNSFTDRKGYDRAMKEAKQAGYNTAEANATFARYYAHENRNARDRSPDGPLAQMLVIMGRRSAFDTHPVGDSPSVE